MVTARRFYRAQFAVINPLLERWIADAEDLRSFAWSEQIFELATHGGIFCGNRRTIARLRRPCGPRSRYSRHHLTSARFSESIGAERRAEFLRQSRNDARGKIRELRLGESRFRALECDAHKQRIPSGRHLSTPEQINRLDGPQLRDINATNRGRARQPASAAQDAVRQGRFADAT